MTVMTDHKTKQSSPRWPLAGLALSIVLAIARILFFPAQPAGGGNTAYHDTPLNIAFCLGFGVIGALIALRQPGNRFAGLMVAQCVLVTLNTVVNAYVNSYVQTPDGPQHGEPLAGLFMILNALLWFPGYFGTFFAFLLLFPDGRLPSARWRLPAALIASVVLGVCLISLIAVPLDLLYVVNGSYEGDQLRPNAPAWVRPVIDVLQAVADPFIPIATPLCFVISLAALVARFRKASAAVRQQIKWFVIFAVGAVALIAASFINGSDDYVRFATALFALLLGTGIGIALLRGKLWDVDIIIRRTLIYTILTLLLGAVYAGLVIGSQSLLRPLVGEQSQVAVVLSTLVIAALFLPLQRRVQAFIDRRFYRRKYNAEQAVARFNAEMRDAVEMDEIATKLMDAVDDTLQPGKIVLWLPLDEKAKAAK